MASIDSDEIDKLNEILSKWTINDLKVVFDEINYRLDVIDKLRKMVNDSKTLEYKHLHPLIASNLWIFGPEFDSCSFHSNKTISTILKESFGKKAKFDSNRPDIVLLPESSIGAYSADKFTEGQPDGFEKIVIIELKRGGSTINEKEKDQAKNYAIDLQNGGRIGDVSKIECYVIGSKVNPKSKGKTRSEPIIDVYPLAYDILLHNAEVRLFNLKDKVKGVNPDIGKSSDSVMEEIISSQSTPF